LPGMQTRPHHLPHPLISRIWKAPVL
jgi:hypothetical protein